MNRKVQLLDSNCKLLKHVLTCFSNLIAQLCNTWVFQLRWTLQTLSEQNMIGGQ